MPPQAPNPVDLLCSAWRNGSGSDCLSALTAAGVFSAAAAPAETEAGGVDDEPVGGPAAQLAAQILDTLPKRWAGGVAEAAVAGGPASAPLAALADKAARLQSLLSWLRAAGAWPLLPPRDRSLLLAAREKAAAAAALRSLLAELASADDDAPAQRLRAVLADAGGALAGGGGAVEAVFEQPGRGVSAFCAAAAGALALHGDVGDVDSKGRWSAAAPLAAALLRLLAGADEARASAASLYPAPPPHAAQPLPSHAGGAVPLRWSAGRDVREALRAAALAAAAARPCDEASSALLLLAGALLDATAAAAERAQPGSDARRALREEHARLRDALLPALLSDAAAASVEGVGDAAAPPVLVPVSIEAVAELARAHRAYDTLYALCLGTGDLPRLLSLMRALPGGGVDGDPPFAHTVFSRLLAERRCEVLLDALPDEWGAELAAWLAPGGGGAQQPAAPALRWMHALRLGDLTGCANALEALGAGELQPARPTALRLAKLARMAAARAAATRRGIGGTPAGGACAG
jgi:hypothetical protein